MHKKFQKKKVIINFKYFSQESHNVQASPDSFIVLEHFLWVLQQNSIRPIWMELSVKIEWTTQNCAKDNTITVFRIGV